MDLETICKRPCMFLLNQVPGYYDKTSELVMGLKQNDNIKPRFVLKPVNGASWYSFKLTFLTNGNRVVVCINKILWGKMLSIMRLRKRLLYFVACLGICFLCTYRMYNVQSKEFSDYERYVHVTHIRTAQELKNLFNYATLHFLQFTYGRFAKICQKPTRHSRCDRLLSRE